MFFWLRYHWWGYACTKSFGLSRISVRNHIWILVDRRSNQYMDVFLLSPFYCRWFTETWQRATFSSPTRMFARYSLRYYLVVIILQVIIKLFSWLLSRFGRLTWWLSRWHYHCYHWQLLGGGFWVQSRRDGEQHLWEEERGKAPNKVISNPYSCLKMPGTSLSFNVI